MAYEIDVVRLPIDPEHVKIGGIADVGAYVIFKGEKIGRILEVDTEKLEYTVEIFSKKFLEEYCL